MKLRIFAVLGIVVLIAAAVLSSSAKPLVPEVNFTVLQDKGKQSNIKTTALRGKVVLVNFWATTCSTCVEEMPNLIETYKKFAPDGLEIIAVAMDYDPEAQVRTYAAKAALPFKVALDTDGEAALSFKDVRMTPTTFLIDRQGRIVHKYLGKPDFGALHALLEELLAKPA
ncbi:MAG: TlpA family protein disulfide reductase [Betaproteobacteria bacterium]|nr:TlpA family protein disulfide reductase [Betaproteobacteria bacterium]